MHAVDLEPVDLMTKPHFVLGIGCTEVTLARPITLQSIGRKPAVLFVYDEQEQDWQTVMNARFTPETFSSPNATPSLILARAFPGVTIHERRNGEIRTLVDCRPTAIQRAQVSETIEADHSPMPAEVPADVKLPYTDLSEDNPSDVELRRYLGQEDEVFAEGLSTDGINVERPEEHV